VGASWLKIRRLSVQSNHFDTSIERSRVRWIAQTTAEHCSMSI
jgi:hypothetical protein